MDFNISANFSVNPDQVHQMCTNFSQLMSNQEQFILHNTNFYALSFFLGCFQASSCRYLCPGDRWTWISHCSVAPHVEWTKKTMSLTFASISTDSQRCPPLSAALTFACLFILHLKLKEEPVLFKSERYVDAQFNSCLVFLFLCCVLLFSWCHICCSWERKHF